MCFLLSAVNAALASSSLSITTNACPVERPVVSVRGCWFWLGGWRVCGACVWCVVWGDRRRGGFGARRADWAAARVTPRVVASPKKAAEFAVPARSNLKGASKLRRAEWRRAEEGGVPLSGCGRLCRKHCDSPFGARALWRVRSLHGRAAQTKKTQQHHLLSHLRACRPPSLARRRAQKKLPRPIAWR